MYLCWEEPKLVIRPSATEKQVAPIGTVSAGRREREPMRNAQNMGSYHIAIWLGHDVKRKGGFEPAMVGKTDLAAPVISSRGQDV